MKKILRLIFLSVTLLIFLFLVLQNKAVYNDLEIQQLHINVDHAEGLYFVDDKIIENLVLMKVDSILGTSYEDINIFMLEEFVDSHPNIKKAELYLTSDGILNIDVKQRHPIVRVVENEDSYYLDDKMNKFSLSDKYTARVLQVYWSKSSEARKEILSFVLNAIDSDDFLSALITAIEFDEKDELIIYPRVGDHKVIIGASYNLLKKFENLKKFYRHGLGKIGWGKYSQINLTYENQVVCTKR